MSDEKFEAYWKDRCAKQRPYSTVNLKTVAEEAWQASRAALKVELPDDGIEDCRRDWPNSCRDNFDTGYCYATDRIVEALQQAGIEVSP